LGGGVKLGPDVKYLESNVYDYKLTSSKQEAFYKSAKKFLLFWSLMILHLKWPEYVKDSETR